MTIGKGTPVWFELNTTDPDAAQRFYAAVADWRFTVSPVPEHGGYRMAGPSEHDLVAGMMDATGMEGGLPGWLLYLASDDVDADAQRVKTLGGAIRFGPMDIPQVGRFALVADPQGIVFALMKGAGEPSGAFAPAEADNLGRGVWIELATPDPDGAFAFYGALFGWTRAGGLPMPVPSDAADGGEGGGMGEYAFIGLPDGGYDCPAGEASGPGAIMPSTTIGAPARWNWYVHVADIDAAVAAAFDGGGRVFQAPAPIPGGAFSANIADPQGHQIGLVGPRKGGS